MIQPCGRSLAVNAFGIKEWNSSEKNAREVEIE